MDGITTDPRTVAREPVNNNGTPTAVGKSQEEMMDALSKCRISNVDARERCQGPSVMALDATLVLEALGGEVYEKESYVRVMPRRGGYLGPCVVRKGDDEDARQTKCTSAAASMWQDCSYFYAGGIYKILPIRAGDNSVGLLECTVLTKHLETFVARSKQDYFCFLLQEPYRHTIEIPEGADICDQIEKVLEDFPNVDMNYTFARNNGALRFFLHLGDTDEKVGKMAATTNTAPMEAARRRSPPLPDDHVRSEDNATVGAEPNDQCPQDTAGLARARDASFKALLRHHFGHH